MHVCPHRSVPVWRETTSEVIRTLSSAHVYRGGDRRHFEQLEGVFNSDVFVSIHDIISVET